MSTKKQQAVTISYKDLVRFSAESSSSSSNDKSILLNKIGEAFGDGDDCLGILAVTNIPKLYGLRQTLLPMARQIALLPKADLDAVTCESAGYQVGWSHGKEKVQGDKFDTAKGSFYANPLTDNLLESTRHGKDAPTGKGVENVARENPGVFAPNVWPRDSLPELETTFKELGQLVAQVGKLVARPCDAYVSTKCQGYPKGKLESIVSNSMFCKGRLLHYFASETTTASREGTMTESNDMGFSDWCGWHNDHGSLTGLVPAIFLNEAGNEVVCPDENAGLYIKSRSGRLIHVQLPPGSLGFQIGETSQIHTGGVLQATPHAVKGLQSSDGTLISRESFAVFMQPEYFGDMSIPVGKTVEETQRRDAEKHLPKTVRTLRSRWEYGMNFGEFSTATFAAFH